MKRAMSISAALMVAGAGLLVPAQSASADTPAPVDENYSAAEVQAALDRGEAREASGAESSSDQALENQLIAASAQNGNSLTDQDVTVLQVGDVKAAVAENVTITEIDVSGTEDELVLSAEAEESKTAPSISSSGPGMGSWGERADGQYVLTVQDPRAGTTEVIGTGTFLWARERYVNDGSDTYNWWSYTRKGIGQPRNVAGDNWQIARLRVQSYPYDSIESGLRNWTTIEPGSDFKGQCDGGTVNTGVSVPGFNAGYSFQDCDQYYVWHNPTNPGSYHITMDQGSYVHEGSRQAGYSVGWKANQGTAGSQHDFQRIVFQRGPTQSSETTCDSYDRSKTCNSW